MKMMMPEPIPTDKDGRFYLFPLVDDFEVSPVDLMAAAKELQLLDRKQLTLSVDEKEKLRSRLENPGRTTTPKPDFPTVRIYDLAKQVLENSVDIVELLPRLGILGKASALASLDPEEHALVVAYYKRTQPQVKQKMPQTGGVLLPADEPVVFRKGEAPVVPHVVSSPPKVKPAPKTVAPTKGLMPLVELPLMSKDPFLLPLIDDVTDAQNRLEQQDTAFHRRTYVRTFFSMAEAVLVTLRDWLWERVENAPLSEREHSFTKTLLKSVQSNFGRAETAQFVLGTYAFMRSCPKDFFVGEGWESFQASRKIRNILTHPKKETGVEVSDSDLATVKSAHKWLFDVVGELEQNFEE